MKKISLVLALFLISFSTINTNAGCCPPKGTVLRTGTIINEFGCTEIYNIVATRNCGTKRVYAGGLCG